MSAHLTRGLAVAVLLTVVAVPATAAPGGDPGSSGYTSDPASSGYRNTPGKSADPKPSAPRADGGLPLGDADLIEMRTTGDLAPGVTLTKITRGLEPADPDEIPTTTRGPWIINVVTIDPALAAGRVQTTYGPDLARTEKTSALVKSAGAVVGTNASFFTFDTNPAYPGDPVGLGISNGQLISEPTTSPTEMNLLIDANSNQMTVQKVRWTGQIRNRDTAATLPLEFINHPPVVPAACANVVDQTTCTAAGDVALFTPHFASKTPSGYGIEIVFDRLGCVVRTSTTRGSSITTSQFTLQATGKDTNALLALTAAGGCVDRNHTLTNDQGTPIPLHSGLYGVVGRYRLTQGGAVVVPPGSSGFFARNPRAIAGTTADGQLLLATIDGRQTTSVGTTLAETGAVAQALGMVESVNLDGGGSTTMARADGTLINHPSGTNGAERYVGDALVYYPTRS
ncbi:phosphodiester glycosidase family protein [Kribbella sp. NPDC051587]|uniref:phosphodiester glycosidase family protein n=1 Tax=Kribbella sp. NPDC051587 TaxID=3364119 RepID=UPI0037B58217